jgi:transitional endoplasmic reticulum ATPase
MTLHHTLWRTDFCRVLPVERRLARYALQFFCTDQRARSGLSNSRLLSTLWQVTLPLLDPVAVQERLGPLAKQAHAGLEARNRRWAAGRSLSAAVPRDWLKGGLSDDPADSWEELGIALRMEDWRNRMRAFFNTLPRSVLDRLAEADGVAPASATIAHFGEALALGAAEIQVLEYLWFCETVEMLRILIRPSDYSVRRCPGRVNLERLAALRGVEVRSLQTVLAKRAPLRSLGLVDIYQHLTDLDDFLTASPLLQKIMHAAPTDRTILLAQLIESAPAAD